MCIDRLYGINTCHLQFSKVTPHIEDVAGHGSGKTNTDEMYLLLLEF